MIDAAALPPAFIELSARLGQDPLQVQGPGGNTSCKQGGVMWIKASGTLLADAGRLPIFVAVDRERARAEALGAGDGTCRACLVDENSTLRPSIETTFHALIDWPVVVHTHSVAALVHAIGRQGLAVAAAKLSDLHPVIVPYRKPGRPLTEAIAQRHAAGARVWLLENHGLICAGESTAAVSDLIETVERRLQLPALPTLVPSPPADAAPEGRVWIEGSEALAQDAHLRHLATAGSYYPDHVVFLGHAVPLHAAGSSAPLTLVPGCGLAGLATATAAQRAMGRAIVDVLTRLPPEWEPTALTAADEAELLDWDAEKYRQALAARQTG
jgi:rhamnose utilization protein RhaD (predicted bifunctional aldolase and dehydrogenase)